MPPPKILLAGVDQRGPVIDEFTEYLEEKTASKECRATPSYEEQLAEPAVIVERGQLDKLKKTFRLALSLSL